MHDTGDTYDETTISHSLRRNLWLALALAVLLVAGFGGWAAIFEISGAVIAPGTVVVETSAKKVQHQEGGIVGEILVRDGDRVDAGDLLLRLDDTVVKANLAIVSRQLDDLTAQEARLLAEIDGDEHITFPAALETRRGDAAVAIGLKGQEDLLIARRTSLAGRRAQLNEQIGQYKEQIHGLAVQRDAKAEGIGLISAQIEDYQSLFDKGLVPESQLTALKRDRAELSGSHGGFIAEIAQAEQAISERRIQILQLDEEFREKVLTELQEVRAKIAQLEEQRIAAEDKLRRVEIRAPRAGFVHQSAVHTVGGVLGAGEVAMLIVPQEDVLLVEAHVQPTDVDDVHPGQIATLRLSSFDTRTTPELQAKVLTRSADLTKDPTTGMAYYTVRLAIPDEERAKLDGKVLVPGMPVEAFIETGMRTVASYFLKPLTDQFAKVFREA